MTPAELRASLAAAPDPESVRLVVQGCAARLRGSNDDDHVGLVEVLLPLVAHPSEKVRRALADACDAFPGPLFEDVSATLLGDGDHFVCAAARRAGERRAARRRANARSDAADHLTAEITAEIETKHGKAARKLAARLAQREVEQFLERMNHESTKLDDAIERGLDAVNAELLKSRPDAAALRASVEALRDRIDLQRSLLRRAREHARTVRPVFALEKVASVVTEAGVHLRERLGDRAARLRFASEVPNALEIHADRHALLQALQSLLQNAVEAYPSDASLFEVRVIGRERRKGTAVELKVEDRGVGMSAEALASLFVPFRSAKPGGTGLGLLMARKMVEAVHGGTLTVESVRGAGTSVVLVLPARQAGVKESS